MNKKRSTGFTIVELMVVISVIMTLSSVVLTATNSAKEKGRDSMRISQIREVKNALALYYSKHGQYPPSTYNFFFMLSDEVPHNWQSMMQALVADGLIQATFVNADVERSSGFSLINIAHANMMPSYYKTSIQDPKYLLPEDYAFSYGYIASADQKSYKIRIYLEDIKNPLLLNSIDGPFTDPDTSTGLTACDKSNNYYCTSSIL